jgi:hypothetical protein
MTYWRVRSVGQGGPHVVSPPTGELPMLPEPVLAALDSPGPPTMPTFPLASQPHEDRTSEIPTRRPTPYAVVLLSQ